MTTPGRTHPSRAIRFALVAIAATLTILGSATAAAAVPAIGSEDPPPECAYIDVFTGNPDFDPEFPERIPAELAEGPFECWFRGPSNADLGQGEQLVGFAVGASYEDFVALIETFLADPAWRYVGGDVFTEINGELVSVGDDADEWRTFTPQSGTVTFARSEQPSGDGFEFVGFDWLDQNFGFPLSVPNEPMEYTADSGGGPILWASYTFYLPEPEPEPEPEPVDDGFGFGDPSVLSELRTAREAATPAQLGFAAGGAVVFGLLLTFPSRLLSDAKDRVLARVLPRLRAWWDKKRRRDAAAAVAETRPARWFDGWPLALAGLFVAAVLTVFIDPRAGFDLGTLRLAGSVFLAFAFDVLIGWVVLSLLVGRFVPGAVPRVTFKPWSFVLVVGAVLFTRVFHLEPGLTVGLVAGIVFAGTLAALQRVRLTLIVLGHGLVLSLLAWIVYSILNGVAGADPDGWFVFLHETLAAITVAGIVALPLALLAGARTRRVRGVPAEPRATGRSPTGWVCWRFWSCSCHSPIRGGKCRSRSSPGSGCSSPTSLSRSPLGLSS